MNKKMTIRNMTFEDLHKAMDALGNSSGPISRLEESRELPVHFYTQVLSRGYADFSIMTVRDNLRHRL